jgi:hypothetical protein
MLHFGIPRRLALAAALLPVALAAPRAFAQDDPNETPLGDVARSLRKKTGSQPVIDDDNFSRVMQGAESKRASGSALRYLMTGAEKGFQVSAPDVTCSLAFNASTKAMLVGQFSQMELPQAEVLKLAGPATIEGDAFTVSVFNATEWHLSEVAVALTIVKKRGPEDSLLPLDATQAPSGNLAEQSQVRPERKPDQTMIYRMRAGAAPWSTTLFSAPLYVELEAGEEWHWGIVQAKGYPPEGARNGPPQSAEAARPADLAGSSNLQGIAIPATQISQSPR